MFVRLAALFDSAFATPADPPPPASETWDLIVTSGDDGTPAPALVPARTDGDVILGIDAESYALWMGRRGATLYAVDLVSRRALYWTARAAAAPAWERSRPFLPIVQVMLDATPWIAVHAAAIAWRGRAALLVGAGRSGKTSLSLAGLRAGWQFAGDDYILLRTDDAPAVAPLYATARLRDDMLPHFRGLEPARREISDDTGERRHELSFNLMPPAGLIGGAPLSSVLLLDRRGSDAPRFEPVNRTVVLASLVANTTVATPGHGATRTAKLLRLLSAMTPVRFDPGRAFGPALDALAEAVA